VEVRLKEEYMMQMEIGKIFSRREWLLVVAILLMLEAWWLNVSYAFHAEQAVINYISFASTIASLLLALLAIIYGFYQAAGQQKSAAALSMQVDAMQNVQRELSETSGKTATQLAAIESAAETLRNIGATLGVIEGGVKTLSEQQTAVHDLLRVSKSKDEQQQDVTPAPRDLNGLVPGIFQRSSFPADLMGVALYEAGKHGAEVNRTDLLGKHYAKPLDEAKAFKFDHVEWLLMGSQVLDIAEGLGLTPRVEGTAVTLGLSPEFLKALKGPAEAAIAAQGTAPFAKVIAASFEP
jgi:hypothetical protein